MLLQKFCILMLKHPLFKLWGITFEVNLIGHSDLHAVITQQRAMQIRFICGVASVLKPCIHTSHIAFRKKEELGVHVASKRSVILQSTQIYFDMLSVGIFIFRKGEKMNICKGRSFLNPMFLFGCFDNILPINIKSKHITSSRNFATWFPTNVAVWNALRLYKKGFLSFT